LSHAGTIPRLKAEFVLACRHNNGVYPVVPILYLDVLREEDEGDAWDMVAEDGNGKSKLDSDSFVHICGELHLVDCATPTVCTDDSFLR
jgi:hypothetical protein